jgi:hypothetical protein
MLHLAWIDSVVRYIKICWDHAILFHIILNHISKCTVIARQRVGKRVLAEANALYNRSSSANQRSYKHESLTIEYGVFSGVRAEELYLRQSALQFQLKIVVEYRLGHRRAE